MFRYGDEILGVLLKAFRILFLIGKDLASLLVNTRNSTSVLLSAVFQVELRVFWQQILVMRK